MIIAAEPQPEQQAVPVGLGFVEKAEVIRLFRNAARPDQRLTESQQDYYFDKLGMPLSMAVDALRSTGELRIADAAEVMAGVLNLSELRAKCSLHDLKSSGKKAELAKRLADNLPHSDLMEWSSSKFIVATELGLNVLAAKKKALEKFQLETLEHLRVGAFDAAAKLVCDYELNQFTPRGIGVNWDKADKRLARETKQIFKANPKFHIRRYGSIEPCVRELAAMTALWGTDRFESLIQRDGSGKSAGNLNLQARMLYGYVGHRERLKSIAANFRRRERHPDVRLIAVLDQNTTCEACLGDNGRTYALPGAPELPHEHCSCEIGCRCTLVYQP